jgi:hypothetical protein
MNDRLREFWVRVAREHHQVVRNHASHAITWVRRRAVACLTERGTQPVLPVDCRAGPSETNTPEAGICRCAFPAGS